MRVLVTGGTGFVGSHTVAAIARSNREIRLFVRDAARVQRALTPHGVDPADVHVGDVTDLDAVRAAVEGCDAVIHCASVFSYDPRDLAQIEAVNVRGTEFVLGAAVDAGCSQVVHVSSSVAFLPATAPVVTEESPVGTATSAYFGSKAASERVARRHQERGDPVVITYPGAVTGPHDPYLQELNRAILMVLGYGVFPGVRGGGLPIVDARDVAAAHAAILDRPAAPARYLLTGHDVAWSDVIAALGRLTGRRLRLVATPAAVARATGRAMDFLQRRVSLRLPFSAEAVLALALPPRHDRDHAAKALGVYPRPLEDSLRDTVRWLVDEGHLDPRRAGALAPHVGRSTRFHAG